MAPFDPKQVWALTAKLDAQRAFYFMGRFHHKLDHHNCTLFLKRVGILLKAGITDFDSSPYSKAELELLWDMEIPEMLMEPDAFVDADGTVCKRS